MYTNEVSSPMWSKIQSTSECVPWNCWLRVNSNPSDSTRQRKHWQPWGEEKVMFLKDSWREYASRGKESGTRDMDNPSTEFVEHCPIHWGFSGRSEHVQMNSRRHTTETIKPELRGRLRIIDSRVFNWEFSFERGLKHGLKWADGQQECFAVIEHLGRRTIKRLTPRSRIRIPPSIHWASWWFWSSRPDCFSWSKMERSCRSLQPLWREDNWEPRHEWRVSSTEFGKKRLGKRRSIASIIEIFSNSLVTWHLDIFWGASKLILWLTHAEVSSKWRGLGDDVWGLPPSLGR